MTGNAEKMTKIRGLNGWLSISCGALTTFTYYSKKNKNIVYICYKIKKIKKRDLFLSS